MPVNLLHRHPARGPGPDRPSSPEEAHHLPQSIQAPDIPGITGSPWKWHLKNQRSGWMSNSATTSPLPASPAILGDGGDAVEHQHGRQRQLGIAGPKQLAPGAGQQALKVEEDLRKGWSTSCSSLKTLAFPGFPGICSLPQKQGRAIAKAQAACLEAF
jgi:hypothetical protein